MPTLNALMNKSARAAVDLRSRLRDGDPEDVKPTPYEMRCAARDLLVTARLLLEEVEVSDRRVSDLPAEIEDIVTAINDLT